MPFRRVSSNSIPEGRQPLSTDLTVTVGTGGDYGTINNALADLYEKYYPIYVTSGFTVEVRLLSGFVMAEQVLIENLDMGWMRIYGEDLEIPIIRSALTESFGGGYPAFGVVRGILPELRRKFIMDDSGDFEDRHGIIAVDGSHVLLTSAGVKNAGMYGMLLADGSIATTRFADMSGAGFCGIYADGGSIADVRHANLSNCFLSGFYAANVAFVNLFYSDVTNSLFGCIAENGAVINANNVDASGAQEYGFAVFAGGIINASKATGTLNQTENVPTGQGIIFNGTSFSDYMMGP
jgi:hypothetical protein